MKTQHLWKGSAPVFGHVHDFDIKYWNAAYARSLKPLDNQSHLALFDAYSERGKAFKILDTEARALVLSKDVLLDEISEWYPHFEISNSTFRADIRDWKHEQSLSRDDIKLQDW